MDKTTQLSVNNHVVVDLGIREFKKLVNERIRDGFVAKRYKNRLIKDFKQRQWAIYHEVFPEDNSSVPTHSHLPLDKLALV